MLIYVIGSALLAVGLLALALQRLYSSVPARELKRLAERGDHLAQRLYRVVTYGASLRLLLWTVLGVALSGGFVMLIPGLPWTAGFLVLLVVSAAAFVWLPSASLTKNSAQFAAWFVPSLVWVLARIHPMLDGVASFLSRHRQLDNHSRLYEKSDLEALLAVQKDQADNRILHEELELAQRALTFGDRRAADIVQSRKETHLVNADDTIGPVLLDQLHKSGQSFFLVYKDDTEHIAGSLSMRDAVSAKHGGRVLDLVRNDLTFIHEDFSLRDVLAAFKKTGHQIAVVINEFEEFIGTVTFDRLVAELLGDTNDTNLSYEDRAAVAGFKPQKLQAQPVAAAEEADDIQQDGTSSEATEVVE